MKEFDVLATFQNVNNWDVQAGVVDALAVPFVTKDVIVRYRWADGPTHSSTTYYEWRLDQLGHVAVYAGSCESDTWIQVPMLICAEYPLRSKQWVLKIHDLGVPSEA